MLGIDGLDIDLGAAAWLAAVLAAGAVVLRLLLREQWTRLGVPILVAIAGLVLLAQWGPATPRTPQASTCPAPACVQPPGGVKQTTTTTVAKKPPATTAPSTTTTTAEPTIATQVRGGGERALRNFNKAVTGKPFKPDVWEWALAALLAVLLLRGWAVVLLRGTPSFIEVGEITDARTKDPDKPTVGSVAAEMRDRLGKIGRLPGPNAPAGQVESPLLNVMSEVPKGKVVVTLLQNLGALLSPAKGYRLMGTLRTRPHPENPSLTQTGFTVQVTETGVNRVRMVATTWAATAREAACAAADEVVVWLTSGVEVDETPWSQRWGSARSLCNYFDGTEAALDASRHKDEPGKQASERVQAVELLTQAADAERANVPVRLRLGTTFEDMERWLDAVVVYAETALKWPDSFSPRYRLAAALGFVDQWTEQLSRVSPEEEARFRTLLGEQHPAFKTVDFADRPAVLRAVYSVWEGAEDAMRWGSVVMGWTARLVTRKRRLRDRRDFTARLAPWNKQRRTQVNVIRIGKIGVEIQHRRAELADDQFLSLVGGFEQDAKRVLRPFKAVNWQVRYNVACVLSHLAKASGDDRHVADAVDLVHQAYWDPDSKLKMVWIEHDPDLAYLTATAAYRTWKDTLLPRPFDAANP